MLNKSAELFWEMPQVLIYFIIRKKMMTLYFTKLHHFFLGGGIIIHVFTKKNVITLYVWKVDFKWFFSSVDIIKEDKEILMFYKASL